jgi:hypothetical protein
VIVSRPARPAKIDAPLPSPQRRRAIGDPGVGRAAPGGLNVGLILHVDSRFLGPGGAGVDPRVAGDQVGLGVRVRSLVLRGEPPGSGLRIIAGQRGILGEISFRVRVGLSLLSASS